MFIYKGVGFIFVYSSTTNANSWIKIYEYNEIVSLLLISFDAFVSSITNCRVPTDLQKSWKIIHVQNVLEILWKSFLPASGQMSGLAGDKSTFDSNKPYYTFLIT